MWPIKIHDINKDGPQYLIDIDRIAKQYGFKSTYSYSDDMLV